MIIERPYNALDNEINQPMQNIFLRFSKKYGYEIEVMTIFEKGVTIDTTNGKHFTMNIADCSRLTNRNITDYFYMKETVNGKQKRVLKNEW
jgi:hypothetical protein